MEEYVLYLDESADVDYTYFLIGGFIIKKSKIEMLESGIMDIKKCIWDEEFILNNNPVLHCVELTRLKDYRGNKKQFPRLLLKYPHYSVLGDKTKEEIKQIYDNVYSRFCKLLKDLECITIGCVVSVENLSFMYGEQIKGNRDLLFDIALQEVISNYSHFLLKNKGVGNILYESRNDETALTEKSSDFKMYDTFCKIKSCGKGMVFTDEQTIDKTIRYLNVYDKKSNIGGLQLADFIVYNFLHYEKISDKSSIIEFAQKIIARLYNGEFELSDRDLRYHFGLKRIPVEYPRIFALEGELSKLKKAHENLKTERNNLLKKKEQFSNQKDKLIEEKNKLSERIDELVQETNKLTEENRKLRESIDNNK